MGILSKLAGKAIKEGIEGMTKKPETVKEEDLIVGEDGLYYKKNAKVPFTGVIKEFYENGQLLFIRNYKNGKAEGLYEWFDENGQLTKTEMWENGARAEEN